jgi:hypothetical protein
MQALDPFSNDNIEVLEAMIRSADTDKIVTL